MPPFSPPAPDADYERLIQAARLELEVAGNPAYVTAVRDVTGTIHVSPIVFSSIGPSSDHAQVVAEEAAAGEDVFIVSRQAVEQRQTWTILMPATLKKLHTRPEVIETTLAEDRAPI